MSDGVSDKFSDDDVDRMRSHLAKRWRQSKSQVTDTEARHYLLLDAILRSENRDLPPEFAAIVDKEFWNLLR